MKKKVGLMAVVGSAIIGIMLVIGCQKEASKERAVEVRVGYFPNITHSQALIGIANETFQKRLGPDVQVKPVVFNAGSSEIEALFAGEIDLGYIGPFPATNGYIKSEGQALRIVAGASSGGASLVARQGTGIDEIKDLSGKKVATPQLGNTQDVSLRHFIAEEGLKTTEQGGTVSVVPTENSDILTLFLKKELDAAWVPEPWATRLVKEADGKIVVDERSLWPKRKFTTAIVIVRTEFLKEHPDLVEKWLEAHVELTDWIHSHPQDSRKVMNSEIKRLTGKSLPTDVLDLALTRTDITYDPVKNSVLTFADWGFELGFLGKEMPDLKNLFDLKLLNKVLEKKSYPKIQQ